MYHCINFHSQYTVKVHVHPGIYFSLHHTQVVLHSQVTAQASPQDCDKWSKNKCVIEVKNLRNRKYTHPVVQHCKLA